MSAGSGSLVVDRGNVVVTVTIGDGLVHPFLYCTKQRGRRQLFGRECEILAGELDGEPWCIGALVHCGCLLQRIWHRQRPVLEDVDEELVGNCERVAQRQNVAHRDCRSSHPGIDRELDRTAFDTGPETVSYTH